MAFLLIVLAYITCCMYILCAWYIESSSNKRSLIPHCGVAIKDENKKIKKKLAVNLSTILNITAYESSNPSSTTCTQIT